MCFFFFFKQKTAYEMLRSLVGSEMCIRDRRCTGTFGWSGAASWSPGRSPRGCRWTRGPTTWRCTPRTTHCPCLLYTSPEPTRLLSISYAVFCLKKKKKNNTTPLPDQSLPPRELNTETQHKKHSTKNK